MRVNLIGHIDEEIKVPMLKIVNLYVNRKF